MKEIHFQSHFNVIAELKELSPTPVLCAVDFIARKIGLKFELLNYGTCKQRQLRTHLISQRICERGAWIINSATKDHSSGVHSQQTCFLSLRAGANYTLHIPGKQMRAHSENTGV
jgi:hypothetical protein